MGSNSRYDRDRPVGDREAAEAHALYVICERGEDCPGIGNGNLTPPACVRRLWVVRLRSLGCRTRWAL